MTKSFKKSTQKIASRVSKHRSFFKEALLTRVETINRSVKMGIKYKADIYLYGQPTTEYIGRRERKIAFLGYQATI